ncbi:uncharacterized protein LOC108108509 [Drosophila eugracilis]|uniref:uncharacterized protein LOC108108509 n=1 Tax=Drosophila eugracilis TaxID=29029 RepID=UPI0007E762D7|nr:uncharacterized protein LOC108108509 [Drosophila eugracilis]
MNVKRLLILIEVFLGTALLAEVRAEMNAYMTKLECINYLPELITNVSCYLNKTAAQTNKRTASLYIEFALTQDVRDVEGVYVLTMKRGSHLTNFTTLKLDYCHLLSSVESQFLLRMVTTQVRRVGNLPLECPFKGNQQYYIRGFTINSKLIPSYLPEVNFISDAQINLKDRKACRIIIHGRLFRRH